MFNKYFDALNRLYSLRNGVNNSYPFIEKDPDDPFNNGIKNLIDKDEETLMELVHLATPASLIRDIEPRCPNCYFTMCVKTKYCPNCGQKIKREE